MEPVPRLLERISRLLTYLGEHPEMSLSDLATAVDLSPATASRQLHALHHLGWVDRRGDRGLWRIGPRLHALMAGAPYRERLIAVARPELQVLSARLQAPVVLASLVRDRRQIILEVRPSGSTKLPLSEQEDLFSTATGRVLIAHLAARPRQRLIDRLGLPSAAVWPGIATRRELQNAMAQIRRLGWERFERRADNIMGEAVPLADGEGGTVALGTWRRLDSRTFRTELHESARRIFAALGISTP
ncbi:hypothetical protein LBMAG53_20850 [Planctomycetota bacterium]|nr:hypothetical protein LBMAG53_20850 [Planctomycetota bacterium]